jgi:hypothetical protein
MQRFFFDLEGTTSCSVRDEEGEVFDTKEDAQSAAEQCVHELAGTGIGGRIVVRDANRNKIMEVPLLDAERAQKKAS